MLIVGLTGGIASGKSTIADMFKKEGAYIIDIDLISRELVEPGKPAWHEVINVFSEKILNDDQTINRKKLGDIVFSDGKKRRELEDIIHPKINRETLNKTKRIGEKNNRAVVIIDVPLLIEADIQHRVDKVVLVYTSPQAQVERLMKRDNLTEDQLPAILEKIRKEVNERIPEYMAVQKYKVHPEEFAKTPKRSIKRFLYTKE